jgi:hypothetical protein
MVGNEIVFVANFFKKKCLAPRPPSSEDFFVDKVCGEYNFPNKKSFQKEEFLIRTIEGRITIA